MKLNAILGKGTGKLGGMVLSVNSGEQIVREYNPKVSNPQTDAQVEQRAKFKLLSQLAAALSTSIAFRKMKMQSPRNRFVSANIKNASYEKNEASVALDALDLTGGSQLIPTLSVTRGTGEAITIALSEAAAGDIKRIVYNIYKVTDGNKLQFIKEVLVSEAGEGRTFSVETTAPEADIVVYAYGIKDTTTRSTTKFEEYEASADNKTAVLDVLRALNSTDYVLTATAGEVLPFRGGEGSSFRNVTINNSPFSSDIAYSSGSLYRLNIEADFSTDTVATTLVLVVESTKPEIGAIVSTDIESAEINEEKHSSITDAQIETIGEYWLVSCIEDNNDLRIIDVYPYKITIA